MPKYKIEIAYDGTPFSGWQIQPHSSSIQGELERVITILLREQTRAIGAGRTDAGAHATKQVAHFVSKTSLDCRRMLYSLNSLLPEEIRVKEMIQVTDEFHAQYSALGKEYHYHLWTENVLPPFLFCYRYHVHFPLVLPLLREAAELFIGEHDFASVANCGSSVKSTVRTLKRISVIEQEGGIRFEFEGDGFLYKMVRNLVGLLLEIGNKKKTVKQLADIMRAKDRRAGGFTVPAKGLFLVDVFYPENIS